MDDKIQALKEEMLLVNPDEIEKASALLKANVGFFERKNFCGYLLYKALHDTSLSTANSQRVASHPQGQQFRPQGQGHIRNNSQPDQPRAGHTSEYDWRKDYPNCPENAFYVNWGIRREDDKPKFLGFISLTLKVNVDDVNIVAVRPRSTIVAVNGVSSEKAAQVLEGKRFNTFVLHTRA